MLWNQWFSYQTLRFVAFCVFVVVSASAVFSTEVRIEIDSLSSGGATHQSNFAKIDPLPNLDPASETVCIEMHTSAVKSGFSLKKVWGKAKNLPKISYDLARTPQSSLSSIRKAVNKALGTLATIPTSIAKHSKKAYEYAGENYKSIIGAGVGSLVVLTVAGGIRYLILYGDLIQPDEYHQYIRAPRNPLNATHHFLAHREMQTLSADEGSEVMIFENAMKSLFPLLMGVSLDGISFFNNPAFQQS
jgi:hypothetical protein